MADVLTSPLRPDDRNDWDRLWAGYLAFYEATLPGAVSDTTWSRLVDPATPTSGFGARLVAGGPLVGFVHYHMQANTWSVNGICYLEDLYVDPAVRGGGIGRALIAAVVEVARAAGASRVFWHTQTGNAPARRLYDSVAVLADFVRYDIPLPR